MQLRWLQCHMSSIGMTTPKELFPITEAAAEYRFDLKRLQPKEFNRLLNTVRQGYTTENAGLTSTLLKLLAVAHQLDEAGFPLVPQMSYVGKKSLTIRTREGREREIANELIAYAQMTDAAFPKHAVQMRNRCVLIQSWDMPVADTIGMGRRARRAVHLKSNFTGIMPMVRQWCSETVAEREPLINFLITVPVIPIRIIHRKEKNDAS